VPDERRTAAFRLLVAAGVTVDKWGRLWAERMPGVALELVPGERLGDADADAALVRLPVDGDAFHAIPLYTEATVVVVPRDHLFALVDGEVTVADLTGETLLRPLDDVLDWTVVPPVPGVSPEPGVPAADRPATTAAAVELVAAGVGVLVVPQSLARLHQRRDVVHRVVTGAPASSVGLVWARDRYTGMVEELIGIVRGRTANSTRGRAQEPPAAPRRAQPPPARGRVQQPPTRRRRGR
jgi:DNA-binding transcriptional LysR family regulator